MLTCIMTKGKGKQYKIKKEILYDYDDYYYFNLYVYNK